MYSHANLFELFELIGSMPDQKVVHGDHFDYIKTSSSIWPYQLFNFKAPLKIMNDALEKIETQVEKGEIPSLLMCDPTTDQPELIERLRTLKYSKGSWMAMSHDLSLKPDPDYPEFQIDLIKDRQSLNEWIDIAEKELMGGEKLNGAIFNSLMRAENCFLFLGRLSAIPVATALLFKGVDNAGIYLVATSNEYRRKGLGAKMTNAALKKARELGVKKVDIQATDSGKPLYAKLGFQEFGEIHLFKIKKAAD